MLRTVSNCPFDCSYCFLQNYLTNPDAYVIGDIPAIMAEVRDLLALQPWRFFRIGTWELGDSLAFESITNQARDLILEFSTFSQAILELKTKSDNVDSICALPHQGRTVISWSVNPELIINAEEHGTARLSARIAAMKKVIDAGYLIAWHFDPMIYHQEWEVNYTELVQLLFQEIDSSRVAWISIGSLRFNPEMKHLIEMHFPDSKLPAAEMVVGADRKMRYIKPLRIRMYQHMVRLIRQCGGANIFTYLCMEPPEVWDKVFGHHPESNDHHNYIFTKALYERYPHFMAKCPELADYLSPP